MQIHELIEKRWSPRAYAATAVEPEKLKLLFEAARWAASSNNEQPWRFLVAKKGEGEAFGKMISTLVEFNQMWASHAPVIAVSFAKKTFTGKERHNKYGLHDAGAALATLSIEATALGLYVHPMAGFEAEKVRDAFQVPEDFEVGAVFTVGYLGDPNSLPDGMRERELAPRTRKPLDEIVFEDTFGKAARL